MAVALQAEMHCVGDMVFVGRGGSQQEILKIDSGRPGFARADSDVADRMGKAPPTIFVRFGFQRSALRVESYAPATVPEWIVRRTEIDSMRRLVTDSQNKPDRLPLNVALLRKLLMGRDVLFLLRRLRNIVRLLSRQLRVVDGV